MIAEKLDADAALMAVSPVDGRYRSKVRPLARYFSEFALIKYRVRVEIEWYLSLAANPAIDALPAVDAATERRLRVLYTHFSMGDARWVKTLEATTNHDVKAVEYFLKERFREAEIDLPLEMIHFACTSEDINNLAYALLLKDFIKQDLEPRLRATIAAIAEFAHRYKATAMLSRTHGQVASPTTMGKEFAIFAARLDRQLRLLERQEYLGKFNGAVGNFNAHHFAYPEVDWLAHSREFVESLGLVWNPLTSQIENHDFLAELFGAMIRINSILLDFARDMWFYIALGYITQRTRPGEVGSSTMPHKVNPIDFENCEGNVGIATALFQHLAIKLPVSRWQRDLSDSTALRAIGAAFGHAIIALGSLDRGLKIIEVNEGRIAEDLAGEQSWEVVAEAIQTLMRRYGLPRPYEALKELTRGRPITREVIAEFIAALPLNEPAKDALRRLTPQNYLGLATELVERFSPGGGSV
ncbi:MAG: adenylosuccinate lyase [Candidatus Binataceae bacterium]|jgi:adenylosuccinate lyase